MSLRTRLALVCAIAVAVVVGSVATIAFFVVRDRSRAEVDDGVRGTVVRLADLPAPELALGFFALPAIGSRDYMQIVYADGRVARPETQALELPVGPEELAVARGDAALSLRDVTVDGEHLRVAIAPTATASAVQFARPLEGVDTTTDDLRTTLIVMGVAGVGIAALLALALSRTVLRPLARLTRAAEHVAATQDLGASIDVRRRDEPGRLAASLNEMLVALDTSRRQQRQLLTDASHELRTPLTSLRTNIEVLAAQPGIPEAEYRRLLDDLTAQLDELTTLMDDLAALADEDDLPAEATVAVDVGDLAGAAVERVRLRAFEVGVDLELFAPSVVAGRRAALERALVNVLDNACKWSPPGERVSVEVHDATITVRDHGPGIDLADLPRVFDRFYRAPSARALPGSGLGLAITRRVVEEHGGSVAIERAPGGGTVAVIRLVGGRPPDAAQGRAAPSAATESMRTS
ncbi:MAG: ATP-binding protein [Acidimicrobiia bacterium]